MNPSSDRALSAAHPGRTHSGDVRSPAPRSVWRELAQIDPTAMPTQSPDWTDCICAYAAYSDASRHFSFPNGQDIVVPVVRKNPSKGRLAIEGSLPFAWGYGGLLSRHPVTSEQARRIAGDFDRTGFSVRIFPNPTHAKLWREAMPRRAGVTARRCHVLDLEGGFDTVWEERFLKKTRRRVRKAEKLDVRVTCDNPGEAAPIFYELYRRSLERWAVQQHEPLWLARLRADLRDPRSKILHIARFMGDACRVWVATHEGRPVAASIVLVGRNADDIMGAMDKEAAAPVNANDLLLRASIADACRAGCGVYHFGESGESRGLSQFKERFGAKPVDYAEYRLERLPVAGAARLARGIVKKAIGFRD